MSAMSSVIGSTARPAKYQLVTKVVVVIDTDRDGDDEDVNYLINDELHKSTSVSVQPKILRTSRVVLSSEVELVSEQTS